MCQSGSFRIFDLFPCQMRRYCTTADTKYEEMIEQNIIISNIIPYYYQKDVIRSRKHLKPDFILLKIVPGITENNTQTFILNSF